MVNVNTLIDRYNKLASVRDCSWLPVWREARKLCYPSVSDMLPEGGVRGADTFCPVAVESRSRLASGIYNWMAPPEQRWFELAPEDIRLAEDDEVKEYFAEVTKEIRFTMAKSNWATTLIYALNNLACGLDGIIYVEEDNNGELVFRCFDPEDVCYSEDAWGNVDTLFRKFQLSSRQILQVFGKEKLPTSLQNIIGDEKKLDEKRDILHCCFPRVDRNTKLADAKNMPYADIYIDIETKTLLKEGGFEEFPFAVCRFEKKPNESYGRGPGINAIPDIRQLQAMTEAYILARERQAQPSYLAPANSIVSKNFDRDPGALIYYEPGVNGTKPEMLPLNPGINTLYQDIKEMENRIKLAFFADIFDPLGDLKQITATEAQIRNEAKMVPFAPIAGNLHNELFRPLLHRVYGILARAGKLPELPLKLADNPDYKIEFVSKIALSIKKTETIALYEAETVISGYAQRDPSVLDNFKSDEIVRDTFLAHGASPKWLRDVDERDQIRAAREQAAQVQAQQQAIMDGISALGNNVSKAPEADSPMDKIMRGTGV